MRHLLVRSNSNVHVTSKITVSESACKSKVTVGESECKSKVTVGESACCK
jgi:hypothetical protein